jgi:flagellar protein FliO/FliZ
VNTVELIGRMLLALGVVLGVMWLLARWARRPAAAKTDRVVTVLARQQLSRNSSVAVLKVMDKAYVLGVTDQSVQLLSETELEPIESALTVPQSIAPRRRTPPAPKESAPALPSGVRSPLAGSVLSPATWRQMLHAARELTVRR